MHQVERRYAIDFDEVLLAEIYPDLDEDEIAEKLHQLEAGELDCEEVVNDSWSQDVDLDWDWLDEDDWWTDRKGGYDVTYKVEE